MEGGIYFIFPYKSNISCHALEFLSSQHNSECTGDSQSLGHWPVSTEDPSPWCYTFRGHLSPLRPCLAVCRAHGCKFFVGTSDPVRGPGPQEVPQQVLSGTATSGKAFCGSVEPGCPVLRKCSEAGVTESLALFLPSVQCQREPFVPDRVNGTENKVLKSKYWVLNSTPCLCSTPPLLLLFL